jgi:hypothetical protein
VEKKLFKFTVIALSLHVVSREKHALFEESRYSVAFRDMKLRDSFNGSLEKLASHKSFEKIYKKYVTE